MFLISGDPSNIYLVGCMTMDQIFIHSEFCTEYLNSTLGKDLTQHNSLSRNSVDFSYIDTLMSMMSI